MGTVSKTRFLFSLGAGIFIAYLSLALTLPVIFLHVTAVLGFPGWTGGLAAGSLFLSAILTRPRSGHLADRAGGKSCSLRGAKVYIAASFLCLAAAPADLPPWLALAALLSGRLLLGWGESLVTVGLAAWGLAALGPGHSGKIMVVMGTAIYGAYAAGSPAGAAIHEAYGFGAVLLTAAVLPLLLYPLLSRLTAAQPSAPAAARPSFWGIVRRIYPFGAVTALQGVGFAVIGTFASSFFAVRGWPHAGWALTCFGVSFLLVRLLFGGLPDRLGGIPVTLVSLCAEAAGLAMLWQASDAGAALLGASLTGIGCSLVYPSMGIEAISRVPAKFRGSAYGIYAVFQDISSALTGPAAGCAADYAGYGSVFLFGLTAAGTALAITLFLFFGSSRKETDRDGDLL